MSVSAMKNVTSPTAQRYLSATQRALASSIGKLSPLQRQHAAASSMLGEKAKADGSMGNVSKMTSDGVSFTQIARSGLETIQNLLSTFTQRLRNGEIQAPSLREEFSQLRSSIDEVANNTEYAGRHIFNGSAAGSNALVLKLASQDQTIETLQIEVLTTNSKTLGLVESNVSLQEEQSFVMSRLGHALDTLTQRRTALEHAQQKLQDALSSDHEDTALIRDVDSAEETLALVRKQILSQAGASMMSQAQQLPQVALSLIGG